MTSRKITIIGGTGFLGKQIALNFAATNSIISVASRKPKLPHELPAWIADNSTRIHPIYADVTDPSSLSNAIKNSEIVVNLVGIMHESKIKPVSGDLKNYTFENCQLKGAENVARACKENGVKGLVHMSAIGADPASNIPYARTKGLGELAVRETFPDSVIIRPSLVFGPEDDFFNRFAKLAKILPFLPVFGGGRTLFQPVYVGDVAEAVRRVSNSDTIAKGKIVEAGGPKVYQYRELMKLLLQESKTSRPIISLPWEIGLIQGFFLEKLPPNLFTLTRDQVRMLKKDNIVSTASDSIILTLQDLGITPTPAESILHTYLLKRGWYERK
ncbi:hypothetical protein HK098_005994 [Nowakowskiella sp. JEL0407]|nr:hypothetical protein HK098_005994 [Nowakowskiella sp. JEL0407]